MPSTRKLRQTALAVIAGFAALVLERGAPFFGKRMNIGCFDRVGYRVHIAALRREYPEVIWQTFEAWARTHART